LQAQITLHTELLRREGFDNCPSAITNTNRIQKQSRISVRDRNRTGTEIALRRILRRKPGKPKDEERQALLDHIRRIKESKGVTSPHKIAAELDLSGRHKDGEWLLRKQDKFKDPQFDWQIAAKDPRTKGYFSKLCYSVKVSTVRE
jgi:hypothetical protein